MTRLVGALLMLVGCAAAPAPPLPPSAWVLVSPPERCRDGGARRDDRTPPLEWDRLGTFPDRTACERAREAGLVDANADDQWVLWSLARCVTVERPHGERPVPAP